MGRATVTNGFKKEGEAGDVNKLVEKKEISFPEQVTWHTCVSLISDVFGKQVTGPQVLQSPPTTWLASPDSISYYLREHSIRFKATRLPIVEHYSDKGLLLQPSARRNGIHYIITCSSACDFEAARAVS